MPCPLITPLFGRITAGAGVYGALSARTRHLLHEGEASEGIQERRLGASCKIKSPNINFNNFKLIIKTKEISKLN